jgi:hypothetical protein
MRVRAWLFFAAIAPLAACGSNDKPGGATNDSGTGGDGFTFDATGDDTHFDATYDAIDPDAACAASRTAADVAPVDLYVMFDKSSSMATKWDPAKSGLTTFLKDPGSAPLHLALNFFPRPPDSTAACDSTAYKAPRVGWGDLPTLADPMIAAMAAETPNGFGTPMYPALGGALLAAHDEAASRPGDRGAVLLVTDGEPDGPGTDCGGVDPSDPTNVANLAASGLTSIDPPVRTFVIGLPGVNVSVANQIAAAGGTDSAIVISDPSTVEAEFEKALAKVKGESLPCDFPIPPKVKDGEIAFDKVNVQWTKSDGTVVDLAQNPGCAGGDGWYYDASPPTEILLCPNTCADVRADAKAAITILLGCQTRIH